MRCRILSESKGRIRVRALRRRMTMEQADILQCYLQNVPGVTKAGVSDRTCDAVICYTGSRDSVINALSHFDFGAAAVSVPEHTGRAIQREYEDRLFFMIVRRLIKRFLLPEPVSSAVTLAQSVPYILRGVKCLLRRKTEVPVLDAAVIVTSMATGDYDTAGSVIFLLGLGDLLEEWTHRKSVDDLAQRMALGVDRVWLRTGETETLVPLSQISCGDRIVVRMGGIIPLDGVVTAGEAAVNQASMTGESLPAEKRPGSYVYAGTVLEEGECEIEVRQELGTGRYDRIVRMIEESEKLKSETESKAAHLADALVPYSLGATILTALLTRNITKALSILMVDFSCALKLAMPVTVLSAMRDCSGHHINVKGGKFLEAVAEAETIVFDKTGTLTHAAPRVAEIATFGGRDKNEMLRLAACLEEHFPHSMANAVVSEARARQLNHEEKHTRVEYIVAHGIASSVDGARVLIGSYHFIFEDEGVVLPENGQACFDALPQEYSHLYLAIGGELAAVICIEDPIRREAPEVVAGLHRMGFDRVVMMTGDSERTAAAVAARTGVDGYFAEVLPEDKAAFIAEEHRAGRKVIMIGDGINDSLALSEADAGIAISAGAAIAREVADITVGEDDLHTLLTLRQLSQALIRRIRFNYRFIMSVNSALIGLGFFGVLPPATTALLHNISTVGIGLRSMRSLPGVSEKVSRRDGPV